MAAITVGTAGVLVRNRSFYTFGQHRIGWGDHNGHVLSSTSARLRYRVYDLLPLEMDHFARVYLGNGASVVLHHYWRASGRDARGFQNQRRNGLIGAFTGFLIAELIKPKDPIKPLDKMFSGLFRKLLPNSR